MEEFDIQQKDIIISIQGLYKSFGSLNVLNGVDLEIKKGENFVVLGRSGSGKSVLIKIIAGLLTPDKGVVNVHGFQIDKLNEKELRKLRLKIGFIFQSSALYDSMSVRENLEFSLVRNFPELTQKEIDKAVEEVLDEVGLLDKIDYNTSELSGGQVKRIGIARTLILKPDILLYDEPTAGLDPITCIEINELINKVQKINNSTSIVITHDLTCAKSTGHRIAMLSEGKFIRMGTFDEVFDSDEYNVKSFYDYNFIR